MAGTKKDALKKAFEAWREQEYIEQDPLTTWDAFCKGFEVGERSSALLEALEEFTEMYCQMVNSGDCGNWDPETNNEVIKARAAIAAARGE